MRKPYVNFRDLKAAVGIRRLLERYNLLETLREQGSRLSGPCPICGGEGGTSFRACQEKNCFMCFRCETGGDMLDFVASMEGCSVRDASVKVAEWFGIETGRPAGRYGRPPASRRRQVGRRSRFRPRSWRTRRPSPLSDRSPMCQRRGNRSRPSQHLPGTLRSPSS
jgi:DNA primase